MLIIVTTDAGPLEIETDNIDAYVWNVDPMRNWILLREKGKIRKMRIRESLHELDQMFNGKSFK